MNYDFSFSQKTIIFTLAGFVFVGSMLFVAGLLVGTSWKAEPNAAANVAAQQPAALPPPAPPAAQQEPVETADLSRPASASSASALALGTPAPVKQAHGNPAMANNRRWQLPAPVSQDDGELKIIQEAEPPPIETAATNAFSVQLGVFTSETDAHQLVRHLQNKGYTPIVLAVSDDKSRLVYSVRIGSYRNQSEAAKAAANISDQEKLEATVRPLGSL